MLKFDFFYFLFLFGFVSISSGQVVSITDPSNDTIVLNATVKLSGNANGGSGMVQVRGGASGPVTVPVVCGNWEATIPLATGVQVLEAINGGASQQLLITRSPIALVARPSQELFIRWNAGVDDVIKGVAAGTLIPVPSSTDQDQFVADVKARVATLVQERFKNAANVTMVAAPGSNTQIIDMLTTSDNVFGQSPFDCGNQIPGQISEIHVGTFRSLMVGSLADWGPMDTADPIATRVEDLAQALSRTSVHESTHSIGLVGDPDGCPWMDGCDGGHNCDAFGFAAISPRFDNGRFIMDPGDKTLNNTRIAEPNTNSRVAVRQPATFNSFNLSYLQIVQP